MVVENPVTLVLYNQSPFVGPYRILNVSSPAYGPQLRKILVGLSRLDSMISGTVVIGEAIHSLLVDEDELEEDEVELAAVEEAQAKLMVLPAKVTVWAAWAKTRPFKVALVPKAVVSATSATTIFPIKEVVDPSVAALPILHHTLQGSPPVTDEPDDVMRVDTVLKIQTPDDPVRVRFPVSKKLPAEQ